MTGRRLYLAVVGAVIALDQITKRVVARSIELHDSREIISGLASLTHVHNRGAAFGFLANAELPYQSILFSVLSLVALGAIAAYALKLPSDQRWTQIALSLIMGGAVGNLADRLIRGYVIDFVDVYWRAHHWPAFNVADSSISIGVVMLILELLRPAESQPSLERGGDEPAAALPHGE